VTGWTPAVTAVLAVSVVAGWSVGVRAMVRPRPAQPGAPVPGGPAVWLGVVVGLLLVNQVLCNVYLLRAHGGDPSFVARYLPDGWFDLATDNPLVVALAARLDAPGLLAPTVLRVQAFLELPFVLLAYLTACRWLSADLHLRLVGSPAVWLAGAAWTATFIAVEWSLRNPYTVDDTALRVLAALVVPPAVAALRGRAPDRAPGASPVAVLATAVAIGALGHLVLLVYDVALLYNLGRLGDRLPAVVGTLAVLAVARSLARALPRAGPGPGMAALVACLRWFAALFLVVALPVRYAAPAPAAIAAGVLTLVLAVAGGVREVLPAAEGAGGPRAMAARLAGQLGAAGALGAAAAWASLGWGAVAYRELALLRAGGAFVVTAVVACAACDRLLARSAGAGARGTT